MASTIDRRWLAPLVLLALTATAHADAKSDAEAEMIKAQEHLDRGEYDAAIARFNVARSLVPQSSGPYLGIGLAYARSQRCDEAIPMLEEYLRRKKASPKPEAATTLGDCRSRQAARVGRLSVRSEPSGAEVRLDDPQGAIVGTTPYDAPAPLGAHRVFVNKSGFVQATGQVAVEAGATASLSLSLQAVAPPRPTTPPPPPRPEPVTPPQPPPPPAPPVQQGTVSVDVGPVDAAIAVNGVEVAPSTRHYEGPIAAGDCRVLASRDGYRSVEARLTVGPGEKRARSLQLQPVRRHGWLGLAIPMTAIALGAGIGALVTFYAADGAPSDSSTYTDNKTANAALQGVFYPSLALAGVGYILWGVLGVRNRVGDGPPVQVTWSPQAGGGTMVAQVRF